MKRILFVCVENSNRSQIAQAFSHIYGKGLVEAYSAGSSPSGRINPKAIDSMKQIGYDLSKHQSKSLDEIQAIQYDYVIGMGCGDACPHVAAKNRLEWNIPDPKNMNAEDFAEIRNMIEAKVKELIFSL